MNIWKLKIELWKYNTICFAIKHIKITKWNDVNMYKIFFGKYCLCIY